MLTASCGGGTLGIWGSKYGQPTTADAAQFKPGGGLVDDERQVVAEGTYGAGLSWLVWAQWQSSGDARLGADELLSMIRVISADGRVLHEGGGGGPALYPGQLMNVSTGGSEEGPYCLLARVHPDIGRVELVTAAGEIMHVPVYDSARFPDVRFAALLVPRELNLDSVAGFSHGGEELERFDLTFHQRFWHQNHPRGDYFSPSSP
jgi:hypothetical protein